MKNLSGENKAVDHVTLLTECFDLLNELGGVHYIHTIETKGNVENFETYENKVLEDFKKRETDRLLKVYLSKEDKDIQRLLTEIEQLNDEGITDEPSKFDVLKKLHDESTQEKTSAITGIPSGLKDLDRLTGGWQSEDSIIMGARPSMGKTATMLKFMLAAALNGDVPIVFSLEMSEESLTRRLLATVGQINSFMARNSQNLSDDKKKSWRTAIGELGKLDYAIYDKPMQSIQYIRTKVRKEQKKYKNRRILVLIDYLTLIQNSGQFNSDHAKVSDISARLKAIAKDFKIPVITLAQLSRGVEQRKDKKPMLSDLRESGSIEQDADLIMFLYRESYYNDKADDDVLEIDIAKHRNGPTGDVKVFYNRSTGEIKDLANH